MDEYLHLPDALPNMWIEAILDFIIRSTSTKHYACIGLGDITPF